MYSVTRVLSPYQDFSKVPPGVLEAACVRGGTTHRICAGIALGAWISHIPANLEGRVESYQRWLDKYVDRVIFVEKEFYCPCYQFVGHPDQGVVMRGDSGITIPDLKTPLVESPTWKGQNAAYRHLVGEHGGYDLPVIRAGSLMLDPTGKTARLIEHVDSAADFNAFIAALTARRYFA